MQKKIIIVGALVGSCAVVMGALGAHLIRPLLLESGRVTTFELAVRYQFYHALLLLVVGFASTMFRSRVLVYAAITIFFGLFLFSGSLYGLSLSTATFWGMLTPFGGLLLVVGWLLLAIAATMNKGESNK